MLITESGAIKPWKCFYFKIMWEINGLCKSEVAFSKWLTRLSSKLYTLDARSRLIYNYKCKLHYETKPAKSDFCSDGHSFLNIKWLIVK